MTSAVFRLRPTASSPCKSFRVVFALRARRAGGFQYLLLEALIPVGLPGGETGNRCGQRLSVSLLAVALPPPRLCFCLSQLPSTLTGEDNSRQTVSCPPGSSHGEHLLPLDPFAHAASIRLRPDSVGGRLNVDGRLFIRDQTCGFMSFITTQRSQRQLQALG